jgi:phosphonate metabolism protein PhnN/1,5-bisphosphokinase (PRPP-forming)
MTEARRILSGCRAIHFARRTVTRPQALGAEDHDSMTADEFDAAEKAGAFLLSWRAHGLAYGIPASLQDKRTAGCTVIANVSRSVVDDARRRLSPVRIIVVTASPGVLARRLAKRGREGAQDVANRLCRAAAPLPEGRDVQTVVNDTALDAGTDAFVAALLRALG